LCFSSTTGAERDGVQIGNHFDPDGSGQRPGIFQSGTASCDTDTKTGFCFDADGRPGFDFNADAKPGSYHASAGC
jgi:hypothetical protein